MQLLAPFRLLLLSSLAACAMSAQAAAPADELAECTNLSGAQQVSRFGNQYIFVRDGDAFYRLHTGNCDKLALATRFEIFGDSEKGRICPSGTQVKTNTGKCNISRIERIDEATYRRYQRRR